MREARQLTEFLQIQKRKLQVFWKQVQTNKKPIPITKLDEKCRLWWEPNKKIKILD